MTQLGKLTLRLGLYGLFIAYLLGDLFVFNGPIRQKIDSNRPDSPEAIAAAKAGGAVARVFHHPITRAQLERAVHDRLWIDGRDLGDLSANDRKLIRYAALGDLIDHQLLRMKVKVNTTEVPVTEEEINGRLAEISARFESPAAMEAALEEQGVGSVRQLRDRIAARLQQEKYVELRVAPLIAVSDEEAENWFAQNREQLSQPEQVEARHIFIRSGEATAEEARAKLEEALASLREDSVRFPALAAEFSQDPSTKDAGGSLGWITRERIPADLAAPLFSLAVNQPQILQTRLGWHLVEVTARREAGSREPEEAKPEVIASLQSAKRQKAARDFRSALRQFEAKHIEIFHDMMAE
jgi:parvulin-like peptidyl-prolyl isomerase